MWIPIARPFIGQEERDAVLRVLDSGRLVQGPCVEELEHHFAGMIGAKHAVATSSGSTALLAALLAHGIGPGDEVIVPALSFFATASSVLATGARPVFADVTEDDFCLCPESAALHVTSRTRAVLPVHLYGHPARLPELRALCRERNLILIEDAAQAHLAKVGNVCVGAQGTVCFSFHASKNATTGEGGVVVTDSSETAERLRLLRSQGMRRGTQGPNYVHEVSGFNFRMPELSAALGVPS